MPGHALENSCVSSSSRSRICASVSISMIPAGSSPCEGFDMDGDVRCGKNISIKGCDGVSDEANKDEEARNHLVVVIGCDTGGVKC